MSRHHASRGVRVAGMLVIAVGFFATTQSMLQAQAVGSGTLRPFVTGWTPVIGRGGAVGGILVDAKGVVRQAVESQLTKERMAAVKSLNEPPSGFAKNVSLRMVSLKRIDQAIGEHRKSGKPLPQEILFLGGLTRIRYVLVDEDGEDIVLAGPAEPWKVGLHGNVVGSKSGQPILRLEDLLVAMRAAADGKTPSCSIDPTEAGSQKLQKLLASRRSFSPTVKRQLEKAAGPQQVTIDGVTPTTRFAHVMLAADVQMKRLAMQLEKDPPERPRGYLQMLRENGKRPTNAAPRWWIAPDYETIEHSPDNRIWRIEGTGLKVLSEDGFTRADGSIVDRGEASELTKAWSKEFNRELPRLLTRYPVFQELRNCIDMAVASAVIYNYSLTLASGCELPNLVDSVEVQPVRHSAPKQIASTASLLSSESGVIIAVSGGVEVNGWKVADNSREEASLTELADKLLKRSPTGGWFWD